MEVRMYKETRYKKIRGQDVPIDRSMNKDEIIEYKSRLPVWLKKILK